MMVPGVPRVPGGRTRAAHGIGTESCRTMSTARHREIPKPTGPAGWAASGIRTYDGLSGIPCHNFHQQRLYMSGSLRASNFGYGHTLLLPFATANHTFQGSVLFDRQMRVRVARRPYMSAGDHPLACCLAKPHGLASKHVARDHVRLELVQCSLQHNQDGTRWRGKETGSKGGADTSLRSPTMRLNLNWTKFVVLPI